MAKRIHIRFHIPASKVVRVIYLRDDDAHKPERERAHYGAVIANPKSQDGLQVAMLARHVALRQVVRVEAVESYC